MSINTSRWATTRQAAIDIIIKPAIRDLGLNPYDYDLESLADFALVEGSDGTWTVRGEAGNLLDEEVREYIRNYRLGRHAERPSEVEQLKAEVDAQRQRIADLEAMAARRQAPVPASRQTVDQIDHQGTLCIRVDFRATLPANVVLEGEDLEQALARFADVRSIWEAIDHSPLTDSVSVEHIAFDLENLASHYVD